MTGQNLTSKQQGLILSWGLLAAVVVVALIIGSTGGEPPTPGERVRTLSGQFACPECAGQSVLHSDAGLSVEIREEITRWVQEGRTDEQILNSLVASYGNEYLLTPSASGAASLAWALPVFFGVLSIAGLGFAFWRWRPSPTEVTDDDRDLVERARSAERDS